jgi:small-conductance mechanosensitive channel/uncharacterized ParB-like nuclease family protein
MLEDVSRMERAEYYRKPFLGLSAWAALAIAAFSLDWLLPSRWELSPGHSGWQVAGMLAAILAAANLCSLVTNWVLVRRRRPAVEGAMIGRLYRVGAFVAVLVTLLFGAGKLSAAGAVLAGFAGMLLGWSLQAPVSGFAAWLLVSAKRPFRPGDRVQFPSLGLTGDIKDIGPMYTVLDQVGGAIGSEEAVGRFILVPNAMLFSQVAINYTVSQEAPFFLDEVTIRLTYDSDWTKAEEILLRAAREVTEDIIRKTGTEPYIRSDIYDYGVLLRLRYQTRAQNRAEIAYEITKRVFNEVQKTPTVDFAIPFVYSSRAGADRKEGNRREANGKRVLEVDLDHIRAPVQPGDPEDIEQMARSIAERGLLQPIVVARSATSGHYEVLAGHLRLEAVRRLGWKVVPAVVMDRAATRFDADDGEPPAD